MSEQDNIKAAQATFGAWNAGDLSLADSYSAEDFQADGPGASGTMNAEQYRMYLQNFLNAFPGSKFEILDTIANDEYVVTHWKVSGAHNGPLQTPSGGSIPPTGKTAVVMGSTTSQLKNGKIIHTWTFWDMASLLVQLGLLPVM